ncbi:hypothetical protein A9Q84_02790 [Halobacteriovorax marinus]|uniref:Uncharacterized protein n=1 Tax=Halobacteriovorax marinus TaxID=97084 RepID=A0A1Y5FGT3_9BACT|nr:hypothetical protein A9Q84_02790 [Halobacteriovorax marinus]
MLSEIPKMILKTVALSAVGVALYYLIPKIPTADKKVETKESVALQEKKEADFQRKLKIARSPSSLLNDISEREEDEKIESADFQESPQSASSSFVGGARSSSKKANSSREQSDPASKESRQKKIAQEELTKEKEKIDLEKKDKEEVKVVECATNCTDDDARTTSDKLVETSETPEDDSPSPVAPAAIPPSIKPIITADIGSGNFSVNPTVALSSDIGGAIYYCLSSGACCDPDPGTTGTTYSTAIPVGAIDGNFCLSYYGESSLGVDGDKDNQNYLVSSTFPNMNSTVDVQYIQTTEVATVNMASTEYLNANYDYGLYDLDTYNPNALNCLQVETNYPHATNGVDFDGNATPDFYDLGVTAGPLTTALTSSIMTYGNIGNFFVSILGNRNPATHLYSCATHKVVLKDFDYFNSSTSSTAKAPVAAGVAEFSGSFGSYGIFRGPATTAPIGDFSVKSGRSRHLDVDHVLESTAAEIMH